jgi:hypothetical protein
VPWLVSSNMFSCQGILVALVIRIGRSLQEIIGHFKIMPVCIQSKNTSIEGCSSGFLL